MRVEGRAVVHRIRSRGSAAVDPGGGTGGWGTGGALCPGTHRRGDRETGAATFCYLFQLSKAASQSHVKRGVGQRRNGTIVERDRAEPAGTTATAADTADEWRQRRCQQGHNRATESRHETGGPRRDTLVPGGLSDDRHLPGAGGRSELVPLVLVHRWQGWQIGSKFNEE